MRARIVRAATIVACALAVTVTAHAQQVQVVRADGPPAWGTRLRVVEDLRIGALEGAEHLTFGSISGVAVGRNGEIYIADRQVPAIRMFDARGRFVRNIGRTGEGPGEYRVIGGLRTLRDGRVALWDNRLGRITLWSATGEYLTAHRVASGLFSADVFEVDHQGQFYVKTSMRRAAGQSDDFQMGWIRVATSGSVLDTLAIPTLPEAPASFVLSTSVGYDRPFVTDLVTHMSPLGYLITGRNDRYAFQLNRIGTPALRIERSFTPLRLGRDEKREWEAWADFFEERVANPTSSNPRIIAPPPRKVSYTIPDVKPAYSEFRTDGSGRIWVRRYVEAQRRPEPPRPQQPGAPARPPHVWKEPPTYDVFEPTGQFLATVTLPWDMYLWDAVDRYIYASTRGEFDEQYVVRLRIEALPQLSPNRQEPPPCCSSAK
jgi:hypothetical protein